MRWNKLERLEASWFQSLSNLRTLNLQGNQIERLDDADLFANCAKLEGIDLSLNGLKSINRRLFHGLYKLKYLALFNNPELSAIDDGLFESLFFVNNISLHGNNIKQLNLPRLFRSCRNLTRLNLSHNQLDNRTFSPESVGNLLNLSELYLSWNQLENIEFVRNMNLLVKLKLNNNKIESIEKDGYNLLGRQRFLQYLDLSCNLIKSLSRDMFVHMEHKLIRLKVSGNLIVPTAPKLGIRVHDHEEAKRRAKAALIN